jgi:hypothetical protein
MLFFSQEKKQGIRKINRIQAKWEYCRYRFCVLII